MSRRKGPRGLRPEEAALWEMIAARTTPLRPERRVEVAPPPPPELKRDPPARPDKPPIAPFSVGEKAAPPTGRHDLARPMTAALREAPVAMDRKAHRKLARGKLSPEGRIDLHGMTLAEAHPALLGFILQSQAMGRRLVLVITGKGAGETHPAPFADRRGVLRRQVPHWLAQAPLAQAVLQIVPAHQRHGGNGAYYVYLRRPR